MHQIRRSCRLLIDPVCASFGGPLHSVLFAAAMSMQRASLRAVRGVRGFHSTPAAGANINFSATISKVSNDADKVRLINLQKVHDGAKGALLGVADSAEAIDFKEWGAKITDV